MRCHACGRSRISNAESSWSAGPQGGGNSAASAAGATR
jgi:hypothetical protein